MYNSNIIISIGYWFKNDLKWLGSGQKALLVEDMGSLQSTTKW